MDHLSYKRDAKTLKYDVEIASGISMKKDVYVWLLVSFITFPNWTNTLVLQTTHGIKEPK